MQRTNSTVLLTCSLSPPSQLLCPVYSTCKIMGQKWHSINTFVRKLIAKQHVFFVATAPLSADGHINVSPKGHSSQTFSIINDNKVAFLDMTGSGIETVSHVKVCGQPLTAVAQCPLFAT